MQSPLAPNRARQRHCPKKRSLQKAIADEQLLHPLQIALLDEKLVAQRKEALS